MPIVSGLQHARFQIPNDETAQKMVDTFYMLNNSLFLKAEFAKEAYFYIKNAYSQYGQPSGEGYMVRPDIMIQVWREFDNLIFELGSILDFLCGEINMAFDLGLKPHQIGFNKVVRACNQKKPEVEITRRLVDFQKSDLQSYFRRMRNRITHRLPVLYQGMNDQLFFPDDPFDDDISPKTDEQIDVLETCTNWIYGILEFVDNTSLLVAKEIAELQPTRSNGNQISIEEWIEITRKHLQNKLDEYHKDNARRLGNTRNV